MAILKDRVYIMVEDTSYGYWRSEEMLCQRHDRIDGDDDVEMVHGEGYTVEGTCLSPTKHPTTDPSVEHHHKGYCLCAVTGRSGNGTQTFFFRLFVSLSSARRIRVASSFSTTEIPRTTVNIHVRASTQLPSRGRETHWYRAASTDSPCPEPDIRKQQRTALVLPRPDRHTWPFDR